MLQDKKPTMVISAPPVASFTTGGCLQLLWSRWEPFAQEQHPLEILAPAPHLAMLSLPSWDHRLDIY